MIGTMALRGVFLLALSAGLAFDGDISGTWTAEMNGPGGETRTISFRFKQDGTTLTGSVDGPGGETLDIQNGTVNGDKLAFTLSLTREGETMKIRHSGTIGDREITLETKMEGGGNGRGPGGPGGGGPGGPGGGGPPRMTLKKTQ